MPQPKKPLGKPVKGLLDYIILQLLNEQPIHGYQVIATIRRTFGINYGPSAIYPVLGALEEKGYVESRWNTEAARPRKIYALTPAGKDVLGFAESQFLQACQKLKAQAGK